MSDEFQSGVCSGNWWNSSPRNGLHASGSVPCSTSISEIGGFTGWSSEVVDMRVRSCEESVSVSDSSMVFQDNQKPQGSDSVSGGGGGGGSGGSNNNNMLMDSTLQMMGYGLSTPTMDWNQGLLNRNSAGRADGGNFHSMIQEELSSRPSYLQENFSTNSGDSSVAFNKLNQGLSLENNRLNLGNSSETCQSLPSSFSMDSPVQYGFQTPYLQGLFEPELAPQPSAYENRMVNNYSSQPSYAMASNELPHSWQKLPKQEANTNQLHFSNNTPFWNPSASATLRPNVLPPVQNQIFAQTFEDKSNCSNYTLKPKAEVRDSLKKPSSEPPLKRARVETPSPLPTFKVRKEKLGDRVTALQQLVSPFGKTDTASVLFEAIEYIKFLHEQVSVLSAPYMKNGAPIQHQQGGDKSKDGEGPQQDLRSRGLCLVPMQSIFPVTNETTADFWTPTFGGTYR